MEKPKVLLITGIHGNEERSQLIVKDFLDKYPDPESRDYTLTVYNFETGFNTRDVHFNLNRMDQVEKLNILAQNILSLKEHIQKSDIIIDIHNTPICENRLLVTTESLETLPDWKVYSQDYLDMIIWRLSKFESLSEFARKLGKISFTAEFGGMTSNDLFTPAKDLVFLKDSIDLCMDLFEMRKFKETDNVNKSLLLLPLFNEYNKLIEVEIKGKSFLYAGAIVQGKHVSTVDLGDSKLIYKDDIEKYNYKIVSPESNYCTKFEGTKVRLNKIDEEEKESYEHFNPSN